MKKLRIKHMLVIIISMTMLNVTIAQKKVMTKDFLNDHPLTNADYPKLFGQLKENITIEELKLGKQIKKELSKKSPIMIIEGSHEFPSPYNIYKLDELENSINIEFISLGNMFGFRKTIMFPLIYIYDDEGNLIEDIELKNYVSRSPGNKFPFHIFAAWTVKLPKAGNYYLLVASDNSSTDDIALHATKGYALAAGAGFAEQKFLSGYPVRRSPFGKYKLTVNK